MGPEALYDDLSPVESKWLTESKSNERLKPDGPNLREGPEGLYKLPLDGPDDCAL